MINKYICLLICFICFNFPASVQAKTYAWLIAINGKAQKLDVDANKIIQTVEMKGDPRISVSLQDADDAVVVDAVNNLLIITNDYGRIGQWIGTYNLRDLKFRKDLEIKSLDPRFKLPKIILPPIGSKFYLIWWDRSKEIDGDGGETYSVFDKTTLSKISDLSSFSMDVNKPWRFSSDGTKIFSINFGTNEIKVYDSITLELFETISIANIWQGVPLFRKGMEYFSNDKALFADDLRVNEGDPSDFRYFSYNIATKLLSRKISVIEQGDGILSPNGNKLIIIEYPKKSSKVHIYDFVTGQKIKLLDLSSKYKSVDDLSMATISPDSSKLYLLGESIESGTNTLIIVDLSSTYNVITEIPDVKGSRMIFFDE